MKKLSSLLPLLLLHLVSVAQSLTIVAPSAGDNWAAGSTQNIAWITQGNVQFVDIYYSTDNGNTYNLLQDFISNSGVYNWTLPTGISSNTCRVAIFNSLNNNIFAESGSFTITSSSGSVTLTNPNGGNYLTGGSSYTITWNQTNINNLNVYYTTDGGNTWNFITEVPASQNSYNWSVPYVNSSNCLIKLVNSEDENIFDVSNNFFNISGSYLTISSPNGGETLYGTNNYSITWSYFGGSSYVNLYYSADNGQTWTSINSGVLKSSASYNWTVPNISGSQYRIKIEDYSNTAINDVSDNAFTIIGAPSSLYLAYPNGGQVFQTNQNVQISWNSSGVSKVNLYYTSDNGANWNLISSNVNSSDGNNNFGWTTPQTSSDEYKIKIENSLNVNQFKISNNSFSVQPPSLTLTSPNGGETWAGGTVKTIYWNSFNASAYVNISYSLDGGNTYTNITYAANNVGYYNWTVANFASTQVRIKIEDYYNNSISDVSDGNFTITAPSPSIILYNPSTSGGEQWVVGSAKNINWHATGVSYLNIEYSTDGGNTYTTYASNVNATTGSYSFTVPNVLSTNCRIRLSDYNNSSINVVSGVFSFIKPSLTVITPNGGETYAGASTQSLYFLNNGGNTYADIEFSSDNGNTWSMLLSQTYIAAGNSSVNFTVPNISSSNCLIRITNVNDNTITDVSDAVFKINYTAPTLLLTEPNGGQIWAEGQSYNIQWTATNVSSTNLFYSADSGITWNLIISGVQTSNGNNYYNWNVPLGINSTKCLIKVVDASNSSYSDASNGVFSILTPTIRVNTPNGGDFLQVGTVFPIKWSHIGTSGVFTIEYKTSPTGTYNTIVAGTGANGSYNWTVPSPTSGTCKVRISDYYNAAIFDESDFNFSIVNGQSATISVYYPGSTTKFQTNSNQYIQWNSSGVSNVKIEYNLNGNIPSGWVVITNSTANTGSYLWSVPATATKYARVRVTDASNSSVSSVSDNFEIVDPYITVTTPSSGTTWTAGTSQYINWDYAGLSSSYVVIQYSTNGGSSWNTIVNGASNNGYYYWSIPTSLAGNCVLIKVYDYGNSSIYGVSAACATIDPPNPSLVVSAPNGGEKYSVGGQNYIYWTANNVDSVKIELTANNGGTWNTVANSVNATSGYYSWIVPNNQSKFCKIRVSSKQDPSVSDLSNNVFEIFEPQINILTPNGGESFDPGTNTTIRWTSQSLTSNIVYLYYSINNGSTWNYITSAYSYDNTVNTYTWSIPNNPSNNCLFKVQDQNSNFFDVSDGVFTINSPPPLISVTYPNGGESLTALNSINITYTSQSVSNVNIEYSIDNGVNWQTIISNTPATGTYAWQLPNVSTSKARVRVTDVSNSQISDMSNGGFKITIPNIEIITPNGGETFITGSSANIKFYCEGLNNYVNLYYSLDSGATWIYHNYNYVYNNQVNTISWSVPQTASTKAYFKIADYYNSARYDTSDYDFNLVNPQPGITVTSPNGGEIWGIGSNYYIQWNKIGVSAVNIYYSTDNGSTWSLIISNQNGNSYYWNVPTTLTNHPYNNCRIKVEDASNSAVFDISNAAFTLTQPGVTVNTPNGGEEYMATNYAIIRWTPVAISNYVNLYYSLDSGITYNYITQVSSTGGQLNSYSWYINNGLESDKAFIKVCDYNNTSVCDVSDAKFRIQPSTPFVYVQYPNGGENFTAGQSYNIQWTSNNVNNVKIEYSLNNGSTYNTIVANAISASGSTNYYNWTVPTNINSSCQVLIKITDINSPTNTDVSNGVFCIGVPTITVITPNGGETWQGGSQQQITWSSSNTSSYVYIAISTDGGSSYGSQFFAANSGTYNYTVPNTPTTQARIRVSDYYNQNIKDVSDNNFTITQAPPSVTVVSPNGYEELIIGQSYNIQWTSVSINEVGIEYSTDNGSTWQTVATNLNAAGGYYNWTVPNTISNQCLVKVYSMSNTSVQDISNNRFTIRAPYIVVNAPNGGEVWGIGSGRYITWSSAGVTQVSISYSINGGASWLPVVNNYQASNGSYYWVVPNTPSTTCRVKVSEVADTTNFDISNANFTIPNPSITITSPNGGEMWASGSQKTIYWNSTGIQNIRLEYSTDNGNNWNTIIASTNATNGYYNWYVPNVTSTNCLIKATDVNNSNYTDVSDFAFTIMAPTLSITYPVGGEIFTALGNQTIRWNSNAVNSFVKIEYSVNGGTVWNTIASAAYNSGSYDWNVPDNPSSNCKIRISDYYVNSVNATSNGTFTIQSPQPTIKVLSPNGGESWSIGSAYNITWNSVSVSNVKIEYSLNGGATWNVVVASTPSTNGNNTYPWYVPNSASTKCRIRISDVNNANIADISDNNFTIPNPTLTLVSPNGGEVWGSPSLRYIYWNAVSVPTVKLEYTTNGAVWNTIVSSTSGSSGSYAWNIPSGINSNNCRVRVSSATVSSIVSASAAKFSIQTPTINVIEPNGGEVINAFTTKVIKWNSSAASSLVKIELSTNNGSSWSTVVNGIGNSGTYNWYVPNTPSVACKIRISDYHNNSIIDESDNTFTIVQAQPSLTLTSPNGGENWLVGNYYYIYWNSTAIQNVKIEYSINNGSSWDLIANSVNASNGYYYWYVPSTVSNQCLVRVSDANNAQVNDVSNTVFSISQPIPSIKVVSPNGGESLAVGAYGYIYWSAVVVPTINILLSIDGGQNYTTIASNVSSSSSSYYWQVPNTPSANCLIKLEAPAYGLIDLSDASFTIYEPPVNNNVITTFYNGSLHLCKGDSIFVSYSATGNYSTSNYFSVQLSDSLGGFSNPIQIGFKQGNNLTDSIAAYIPTYVKNGAKYKVRVVSSDLPAAGAPNSQFIKINSPEFDIAADDYIKFLPDGRVKFVYIPSSDTAGLSYNWNFGDGNTSTQMNPLYYYSSPGFYTVSVKASDAYGCSVEKSYASLIRVEQVFPTITIPPASNNNLNAVSMINAFVGCAVGNSGTILLTNNGGVTWTPVQANVNGDINSVYMYNQNVAILVTSTGYIYQTLDGGLTFSQITSSNTNPLLSVAFKDSANVFIVGENGTIIKLTGNLQSGYSAGNISNPISTNCNGIAFGSTPYCVGSDGKVYQSILGNWNNVVYSGPNIPLNAIAFEGTNLGYAVGGAGNIVRYKNGTWSKVFDGLNVSFTSVQIKDTLTAYVVGEDGVVYLTEDGGDNWERYSIGNTSNLRGASYKSGKGVIVGNQGGGFRFGGNDISFDFTDTVLCAGQQVLIDYQVAGNFNAGNIFKAELSNESGDFSVPTLLGYVSSSSFGSILATVPANTVGGNGYRIRVVSTDSAVVSPDNGFDITIRQAPVVNLGADTSICSGSSLTLAVNNTNSSFVWSTGDNSSAISVNTTGGYSVQVTDLQSGCTGKDSIFVDVIGNLVVDLGPDISTCNSSAVELDAGVIGAFYSWSTGATTQIISATNAGTYWVSVSKCNQTVTDTVKLDFSASIAVATISIANGTLTAGGIVGTGVTYQWFKGNNPGLGELIPGATSQTFTPLDSGWYYVMVTNQAGCFSYSSAVFFSSIGFAEYLSDIAVFNIFPNPTNGVVKLRLNSTENMAYVQVYDLIGKEVVSSKISKVNSGLLEGSLNLNELPTGVYLIKAKTNSHNYQQRLVIER